jgi:hypothetical protein
MLITFLYDVELDVYGDTIQRAILMPLYPDATFKPQVFTVGRPILLNSKNISVRVDKKINQQILDNIVRGIYEGYPGINEAYPNEIIACVEQGFTSSTKRVEEIKEAYKTAPLVPIRSNYACESNYSFGDDDQVRRYKKNLTNPCLTKEFAYPSQDSSNYLQERDRVKLIVKDFIKESLFEALSLIDDSKAFNATTLRGMFITNLRRKLCTIGIYSSTNLLDVDNWLTAGIWNGSANNLRVGTFMFSPDEINAKIGLGTEIPFEQGVQSEIQSIHHDLIAMRSIFVDKVEEEVVKFNNIADRVEKLILDNQDL